jgi:Protein of unknown function (DUF2815)
MPIITPVFIASYPSVLAPKTTDFGGAPCAPYWEITMLFLPDSDVKPLQDAIKAIIDTDFGGKSAGIYIPLKKDPETNQWKAKAKTKTSAPGIVRYENGKQIGITSAEVGLDGFYAGCYAMASVNPYAWRSGGNKGISFGLNNLCKVGDGTPLGGRKSAAEDFAPIRPTYMPLGGDNAAALFGSEEDSEVSDGLDDLFG